MHTEWIPVSDTIEAIMVRMKELGAAPPPAWIGLSVPELATEMRLAEARERLVCDAIMRSLLHSPAGIGKPTALQAYLCSMRCMCALDTLGILHAGDRPLFPVTPKWSEAELLEWLLVSNWQYRHDIWLKLCAFAASTGRDFYSG